MAKSDRKDIIQSYIITTAKFNFSVYEKRILYRIVENLQFLLDGKKLNQKYKIDKNLFGDFRFQMPISDFLKDGDKSNHKEVKKAFKRLQTKILEYEDDKRWASISLLTNPILDKYSDIVSFTIHNMILDALMNFSKGYRKYELKIAMQFESVYAMRFYELISGQKTPICYSIDQLKEIFQITNKYTYIKDFRLYVLDVAKKELDKCSPYTFTYEMNKTGRKFTSITFYPKYQPQFRDDSLEKHELQKQLSLSWDLSKEITDYLIRNFEFTKDGIKNNLDLFKQAHEELDLISFLAAIKGKVRTSKNPQGYIIGAIKKQLA